MEKEIKHLETKTGESSFVQSLLSADSRDAMELVYYFGKTKDFKRLSFERNHSPSWVNVSMEKIKNNRRDEISFEINKSQLNELIANLQAISETISEHPDTKIIVHSKN